MVGGVDNPADCICVVDNSDDGIGKGSPMWITGPSKVTPPWAPPQAQLYDDSFLQFLWEAEDP